MFLIKLTKNYIFKGDSAKALSNQMLMHVHCTLYRLKYLKAIGGLDWDWISECTSAVSTGANNM